MKIRYNVTGDRRKELVKAISGITGAKAVYKFMPTCNYEIDYFTVTKDGTLLFDDRADSEEVERVLEGIAAAGFAREVPVETTEEPEEAAQEENVGLTIAVPLDKVQVRNLTKLLDAKGSLIKKALGIDDLRFELQEDRVAFPWFAEPQPEEATAYTHFIAALCRMSKDAKRITAKEKPVDNEKYAFRCFLLRLGFIGDAYKTDRKILLRNLSGSSAFKSGKAGKDSEAALIEWEKREQHFPFPFSRGQTTAYNAWKESKANGLEIVECRDLPWEKDFPDFIETLREARIEAILVTDSAFSNKRYTYLFEEAGCIIVGHQMFVRHEKRSTGIENVDTTGILVVIDGESVKAVDSDD